MSIAAPSAVQDVQRRVGQGPAADGSVPLLTSGTPRQASGGAKAVPGAAVPVFQTPSLRVASGATSSAGSTGSSLTDGRARRNGAASGARSDEGKRGAHLRPAAPPGGAAAKDAAYLLAVVQDLQSRLHALEASRPAARPTPIAARLSAEGIAMPAATPDGAVDGRSAPSGRPPASTPPKRPLAQGGTPASEPRPPAGQRGGVAGGGGPEGSARRLRMKKRASVTTLSEEVTGNFAASVAGSRLSLLEYLHVEVLGAQAHGPEESGRVQENLANFLSVPWRLEQLLVFGFFVCLDTFLYMLAYLPVKFVAATVMLLLQPFAALWRRFGPEGSGLRREKGGNVVPVLRFHRTHMYDLMRVALLVFGVTALQCFQLGRVYHFIRGQAMIKLYVLIAMVEISDKLMSSFGQDAMDALYWQARRNPRSLPMISAFLVAAVYTVLHSTLLFVHVATLNVAINSADAALLTLLVSSNFAEIKSFVFKKFSKVNVFQLSCHDIVERFKLSIFMFFIAALGWSQSKAQFQALAFLNIVSVVLSAEMLADWVKHAFIAKFNGIDASSYGEHALVLATDIASCRRSDMPRVINDHTYAITKRIGLAQIPLACLFVRVMGMTLPHVRLAINPRSDGAALLIGALAFVIALLLKILTGVLLMAIAKAIIRVEQRLMERASWSPRKRSLSDAERREELDQYRGVDRYTPIQGKVV